MKEKRILKYPSFYAKSNGRLQKTVQIIIYVVMVNKKKVYGFLVCKETVVLRLWERSKQKFDFIKGVGKG